MASIWIVAYDSENSELPGQHVEVTIGDDGTLSVTAPPAFEREATE